MRYYNGVVSSCVMGASASDTPGKARKLHYRFDRKPEVWPPSAKVAQVAREIGLPIDWALLHTNPNTKAVYFTVAHEAMT